MNTDAYTRAHLARPAMQEVVGDDWLITDDRIAAEFSDPYDDQRNPRSAGAFVVQPANATELQQIVEIANEYQAPLWLGSQGRNNGYGGGAPRVPGSIIVNLRRMNRVLEVNEAFGYAVIEPGVSFAELNAYLVEHNYALWTDVPDLSWGSVIGNTLEHGVGYTPYGEHADQVCGMEVVLPDGSLVRTGMGAQANSKNFHTHSRGFGPRLDQFFMQSNFGIVTKMGLWLMPRPEKWRSVWVHCDSDAAGYQLIDAIRPLLLDRTISNRAIIMNLVSIVSALSKKTDWHADTTPVTDDIRAAMRERLGLGNWNARIGLYGSSALMDLQQERIAQAIAHIDGVRLVSREYDGDAPAEAVNPADHAMAGIPNMDLLRMLDWYGFEQPGHVAFAPIAPLTGDDARTLHHLLDRHCTAIGLDYGAAFAMTARSMQLFALVLFNAGDAADVDRTFQMTQDMITETAALGYGEYRGHLELMDVIADQFDFNDHAGTRLNEKLKDALDPNGILAPGRQGIWPAAWRELRGTPNQRAHASGAGA